MNSKQKSTRLMVLFLLSLCSLLAHAQQDNPIFKIGKLDTIQSQILKEKRNIWIELPHSYNYTTRATRSYPVLYLLDAEPNFPYVTSLVTLLTRWGNTAIPEMIIVGITNTDRLRDMTPTHMDYDNVMKDSSFVRTSGGGENFIRFMREELIPHIDKKYRTLPNRTIIGHSASGLLVTHTLLYHPDLFDNYLAIDPSLWWDNEKLVKQSAELLKNKNKYQRKTLYMAISNTLFTGAKYEKVRKDTSRSSTGMRPQLLFSDQVEANKSNGLRFRFKYFPEDSHPLVPINAIPEGLRFVYDFFDYRLPNESQVNFTMAAIRQYEQHFENISKRFGFAYPPPEELTELLTGLAFMRKRMPEAEYLIKLNVKNYPTSHRAHTSMGDFYSMTGDKEKAKEFYKKALQISDSKSTRGKLEKLEQGKP